MTLSLKNKALLSLAVPLSTFCWYTLVQQKTLYASVAFPALSWIDQLRQSIGNLPDIIWDQHSAGGWELMGQCF